MTTKTGWLLAATIGVAVTGCTSTTEISSKRALDIQSTKVAAYIPAAAGQSSVSTYAPTTYAELSPERILDIQSTRVAAYIPTAIPQSPASTRVASTRAATKRPSKAAGAKSKSAKSKAAKSKTARLKTARLKTAKLKSAKSKSAKSKIAKSKTAKLKIAKSKSGKSGIHGLVSKHARANGVPVKLAMAVVQVESNFNPRARGQAGEVGLMQIKPATARGIGYKGSIKALYNPETNLAWGMKYLAEAHRRGGGSVCGTVLKYNAGHYAKRMNKISSRYCGKVKLIMRKTA